MTRQSARPLIVCILLIAHALPALAAVEREDIIILGADGRQYTSYKTLRSDLSERVLYLSPEEDPDDALFIVPSKHEATALADGGTQLRFQSGSYALMNTGRFDEEVTRADDGDLVFASWDGLTRADGHLGKWNSPGDFASFAYSWVVPDNIAIVSYRANRAGKWRQRGNTLSWRGEDVNDIAFTIRYRVNRIAAARTPDALTPPTERKPSSADLAPSKPTPTPSANNDSAPEHRDNESESAVQPEGGRDIVVEAGSGSADRSVSLDSVVILANGRPMITARGHNVLERLAAALTRGKVEQITVTGPNIANSRDTGGSAAQAARVADYLGNHGVDSDRIAIAPGEVLDSANGRSVDINVKPGSALNGYAPGS